QSLEVKAMGKVATFLLYGAIAFSYFVAAEVLAWMFLPPASLAGIVGQLLSWSVAPEYPIAMPGRRGSIESASSRQEVRVNVPKHFRENEEHEGGEGLDDGQVRVGITDYAQDQLGDVVYVELPEPGTEFEKGAMVAEVESTKSVAEVYAPLTGTVTAVN